MKPKPLENNTPDVPKELKLDMEQPEPVKPPQKSLTVWGIVATLAAAVATMIGLDPDLVLFLEDGIQWTDATAIATLIGAVVIYIGRKRAAGPLGKLLNR